MDVGAPAVVAAIHDATGVWIHDLPASPERILAALTGQPKPAPPGISDVIRADRDFGRRTAAQGLDPAPDAPTDPQPLRGPSGTGPMSYRLHRQPRAGRARRARHAPPARRAARGPGPDRHQGGLRRGRVRRVLGHRRRPGGRLVPRAGLPGRGRRRADRRRAWPATASSTRCSRHSCEAGGAQCGICTPGMLMAARAYLDDGGAPVDEHDPRGDRRQPVPLHGLHQDHRRHRRWRPRPVSDGMRTRPSRRLAGRAGEHDRRVPGGPAHPRLRRPRVRCSQQP